MKAVVGATGFLGSKIARRLLGNGEAIRTLVRSDAAAGTWMERGAEVVRGDLKDPQTLDALCAEVDVVITTANAITRAGDDTIDTVDLNGNRNLIDAAKRAGVKRFVFISAFGADPSSPIPLMRAKGETEQYLKESGLEYTILQPHVFMDVWLELVVGLPIRMQVPVRVVGSGRCLHSFISADDVAAFAVAAANRSEATNRTLMLGGPDAVSWREIIAQCEELLEGPVVIDEVDPGTPFPNVDPEVGSVLGDMLAAMDERDVAFDSTALYREFGITPTAIRTFLVTMLASRRMAYRGADMRASPAVPSQRDPEQPPDHETSAAPDRLPSTPVK